MTVFRQRFGLFSQPVSTAIGETNKYKQKPPRRNEDGEVETEPRNFYTQRMRKGKDEKVYFSKGSYIAVGDPYVQRDAKAGMRTIKPQN